MTSSIQSIKGVSMRGVWRCVVLVVGLLSMVSCTGVPEGVEPVSGFDRDRYLGTWYEVARLDHSFERGLEQVTATYSLNEDGSIRVLNRGWDVEDQEWQEAEGRALPVDDPSVAHLKVSFFGPFYGSYVVFELGEDYDYAFVAGFNTDYLWLLARSPDVSTALKQRFIGQAAQLGFDVGSLIWLEGGAPSSAP
jgi:apolipoprotein D and lipocalin family protein